MGVRDDFEGMTYTCIQLNIPTALGTTALGVRVEVHDAEAQKTLGTRQARSGGRWIMATRNGDARSRGGTRTRCIYISLDPRVIREILYGAPADGGSLESAVHPAEATVIRLNCIGGVRAQ